jgi:hypothetical protein
MLPRAIYVVDRKSFACGHEKSWEVPSFAIYTFHIEKSNEAGQSISR